MKHVLHAVPIVATCIGCAGVAAAADQVASAKAEVLLKTTKAWNGQPYVKYPAGTPELTVMKITIAPHTKLPWHTHPIPNAVLVLSGDLTIEQKTDGKTHVFHEGEAFGETLDSAHRGMAGDKPVTVLLVYAGVEGTPTSVPLNANEKEY